MTTPTGIKKSQFVSSGQVSSSDTFDFVSNGQNFKIPFSDIINSLGVTGVIRSSGSDLAVSILQQPSSNYNIIRGLESGAGTAITTSPQNGIKISTKVGNTGVGSGLIVDKDADVIQYKSISAGQGIIIADDGETITLQSTTAATSSKTVVVTELSDFPTAVGGVITLENDTDYFIANDITTSNRFVLGLSSTLRGPASQIVSLTYTGPDTMLTSTNPNFRADRVTLNCPSGKLLDISSPGGGIFQMIECTVDSCVTIGDIQDMFVVRFKGVAWQDIQTNGITFAGTNQDIVLDTAEVFLNGGTFVDLGSSVNSNLVIEKQFVKSAAAATFLSGLVSSGNIAADGLGVVQNCRIPSPIIALSNISTDDARWNFTLNDTIGDTRPDTLLSFTTPTTTTLAAATPTLINGTWVVERHSQMTGTASGRITYDGGKAAVLPISLTISAEPVSGTNKDINFYLAKNGTVITASKAAAVISSSSAKNQTVIWQDSFSTDDYYEAFVESVDGTDVQINSAIFRVN